MRRIAKNMSFLWKLMLAFSASLLLSIVLIMVHHTSTTYSVLEKKSTHHLEVLTEQVALNFRENQNSIEKNSYSAMTSFNIPSCLTGSTDRELRDNLSMMVNAGAPYDFVMVQAKNGQHSTYSYQFDRDTMTRIRGECSQILESIQHANHAGTKWIRSSSGEVYLFRDVYQTSPLRHTGSMVIHMRSQFFTVQADEETSFLFFDNTGNFITQAGVQIMQPILEEILRDVQENDLSSRDQWQSEEYFTTAYHGKRWNVVGITSTRSYRQSCMQILMDDLFIGAAGLLIGVVFMYILSRALLRKLKEIQISMDKIARGEFGHQIPIADNDEISRLAVTFNYMSRHISDLLKQLVEKERMRNTAELQVLEYKYRALETQIRPHFIYNAMETVNAMAKIKGDTEIAELVQRISRYFRSITLNTTHQYITVQQEFDHLQDYTDIYRFIHGDRLRTVFTARDMARNAMIPTMILQPIVENALHYGLRDQNQDSEVRIHAYVKEDKLFITVRDSGHGLTPEQAEQLQKGQILSRSQHTGIGLSNVRDRLNLIYGDKSSITLRNRESGGIKVTIEMPVTYSEPDDLGTEQQELQQELEELAIWEELEN